MATESNTRRAFFFQQRARYPSRTATQAWESAARDLEHRAKAQAAYDSARAELASFQENPPADMRRYAPGGVALTELRAKLQRASATLSRCSSYTTAPRRTYPELHDGLRYVGRVESDSSDLSRRDDSGWITDPYGCYSRDGDGLAWGVVYQLPGRAGVARFVAGYGIGDTDSPPHLDLSTVYTCNTRDGCCWEQADAAKDSGATGAADDMAKKAAEAERDYRTAWQAGTQWAAERETVATTRRKTLDLLKQNRESGGSRDLPAIHATICKAACDARERISAARERMASLAQGDCDPLYFWAGDSELCAAFCEGAGLDAMPGGGA